MTDSAAAARRRVEAVWRIESARIVATLTRVVGDFGLAEDLAQEALVDALAQWPRDGVPPNPGAWLTTVAKRKAIDRRRRLARLDDRHAAIARALAEEQRLAATEHEPPWDPGTVDDDVLRLVFVACHPILPRESQIALTLRVVGGLTTDEIARAFMVPVSTVQQRVVRAKRTIAAASVPFEVPPREELGGRLASVLQVVYLIFNEGYAATSGTSWMRTDLAGEALRLARTVSALVPDEPDAHALLALLELQASRFAARIDADGEPILLADQDRSRWDHGQIQRGRAALARADAIGRGRGAYALQAAIAECHAVAPSTDETDWDRIVRLYEALADVAPSPVADLNRAVAVAMAGGPAAGLAAVDELAATGALSGSALLPGVRGELLARLGRRDEAREELLTAAALTRNERERAVLLRKAERT
ncbi:RNA polymerase subunit sigma-24 [Aeromicrobium chenweiae]|uniref:RNA polymerase sigma factor n=1 Tax=Aeromicrobium chenweiae TaxID=2079793 RepID=A0A2S0WRX4_9ACTN|nr:RNA polymerase subunit sigma-24 [Aeromicrobium chenweiae]TGN33062.1 sigma-70 family RNA polymerase sigma factor [Aeromicrobium chenweiae]